MQFTFLGFTVEICREKEEVTFNRWHCNRCEEFGWFPRVEGMVYPSGDYDWKSYPEMRCECRRHHEEANR